MLLHHVPRPIAQSTHPHEHRDREQTQPYQNTLLKEPYASTQGPLSWGDQFTRLQGQCTPQG